MIVCEAEFEAETTRLAAAVSGLAPTTPVPTCPEWTVRDLVTHVGTGHRWAAEIVEGRMQTPRHTPSWTHRGIRVRGRTG